MAFAKLLKTDSVIRGGNDHYELLVFGIAPYGSSVSKELISYGSAEERLNRRVLLKENVNEAENKEQEDTTMEKDDELPIDFIVLVCSTQSKRSFDLVKEAVLAIGEDAYHFMMGNKKSQKKNMHSFIHSIKKGKWVLVVMDPYEATRHDVSLFDIQKWALERANMPVLYCEHDVRESVKACAGRVGAFFF